MVKCKWRKIVSPWFYTVLATHKRWRKSDHTTQRQRERGSWTEAFEGSENLCAAKAAQLLQLTLPEKILANNAFPLSLFCGGELVKKKPEKLWETKRLVRGWFPFPISFPPCPAGLPLCWSAHYGGCEDIPWCSPKVCKAKEATTFRSVVGKFRDILGIPEVFRTAQWCLANISTRGS